MRADGCALAIDGIRCARNCGGEADAVLGMAYIVIHRFGDARYFDAELIEVGGVAQGVIAANSNEVVDFQVLEVGKHLGAEIVGGTGDALFGGFGLRERLARKELGHLLHS